jgi:hypothetical protein
MSAPKGLTGFADYQSLPHHHITRWIGAASFEERSLGSLRQLAKAGASLDEVLIMLYETETDPLAEGEVRRRQHLKEMKRLALLLNAQRIRTVALSAYSYGAAERFFAEALLEDGCALDVSCLTKVHSLAAAASLAAARIPRVFVAYSVPQNYPGVRPRHRLDGWSDIIVAPLARTSRLFNENSGRGMVLLGHESDRLIVALAEIEPAGGSLVFCASATRPDLVAMSRRRNQKIVRQLTAMRTSNWSVSTVQLNDLASVRHITRKEVDVARAQNAPIILFPYGPKPFLVGCCYEIAASYKENAWFVYPIPRSYDVNYTEGVSEVRWFCANAGST